MNLTGVIVGQTIINDTDKLNVRNTLRMDNPYNDQVISFLTPKGTFALGDKVSVTIAVTV